MKRKWTCPECAHEITSNQRFDLHAEALIHLRKHPELVSRAKQMREESVALSTKARELGREADKLLNFDILWRK